MKKVAGSKKTAAQGSDSHQRDQLRAWLAVARCCSLMGSRLSELLRPLDLSVAQYEVLAKLTSRDGITQQELAGRLLVTKGNVTGLIVRLAERGLVERRGEPADARKKLVFLTRRGHTLASKALRVQDALVGDVFEPLSEDETAQMHDLSQRIISVLRPDSDSAT